MKFQLSKLFRGRSKSRNNLATLLFPGLSSGDAKNHHARSLSASHCIAFRARSANRQVCTNRNEMRGVRGLAEPGDDIQGNREDSSIRNSQHAPHRAQLGTAAQSINDTQAAVRFDVVVYHAHSRTGITKRLNDAQKSLRESAC